MTWKVIDKYYRLANWIYPIKYILENIKGNRKSWASSNDCIIIGDKVIIKKDKWIGEYLERIK